MFGLYRSMYDPAQLQQDAIPLKPGMHNHNLPEPVSCHKQSHASFALFVSIDSDNHRGGSSDGPRDGAHGASWLE